MNGNLFELFRSRWAAAPEQVFLRVPDGHAWTYGEVDDRSARMATVLHELSVTPGDRVMVQAPKSVDGVALYLAALRVGAVYVPLNTAYVGNEVAFFVDDAEPTVLITADAPESTPTTTSVLTPDELRRRADAAAPTTTVATRMADDLAAMLYTSGTTGRSKGAMLTHTNLVSNAITLHQIWRFEAGDVLLHTLPIFHVHGLFVALHTAILNRSEVIFLERFTVDAVLDNLGESTVMMGVPTHYVRLLDDPRLTPDHCRTMRLFTSGSAPMTEIVHAAFTERTGHHILERYGMTEGGMMISNPYDGDRIPGTVGFPLPGVHVRIRNETGELCGPNETGILEVAGPNMFAGYWRLPDRTEAEHRDDGFFITGDVGFADSEGRVTLEGRSSDMIISGGLNIYPRELEMVLDDIPGVKESAVVGLPHPDFGEAPLAVLVADAAPIDLTEVQAVLDDGVARFKHPRRYEVVDELPRNAMGKVQKSVLRERFAPD